MTDEAVLLEPVAGLSQVERVVDTFVAPSKTFTDILRSANWVVPFLLMTVLSYVAVFAIDKKVGWDQVIQNQTAASPKAQEQLAELTPEQRDQRMKVSIVIAKVISYIIPLFILAMGAVVALVFWASFNFGLGAQTKYSQVLAVWMYASLPKAIQSLLITAILFLGHNQESYDPNHPIGTNLGYFLTSSPNWLRTFFTWFDLFGIWSLVLLVIGMAVIAKKKTGQSAAVVVGWWVLCLLVAVGFAAIS